MTEMPNVRLVPRNLSEEDQQEVVITFAATGAATVIPYWEMRKVLGAIRRQRRHQTNRAARSDFPTVHSSSAVEASALARAEQAIATTLGLTVVP